MKFYYQKKKINFIQYIISNYILYMVHKRHNKHTTIHNEVHVTVHTEKKHKKKSHKKKAVHREQTGVRYANPSYNPLASTAFTSGNGGMFPGGSIPTPGSFNNINRGEYSMIPYSQLSITAAPPPKPIASSSSLIVPVKQGPDVGDYENSPLPMRIKNPVKFKGKIEKLPSLDRDELYSLSPTMIKNRIRKHKFAHITEDHLKLIKAGNIRHSVDTFLDSIKSPDKSVIQTQNPNNLNESSTDAFRDANEPQSTTLTSEKSQSRLGRTHPPKHDYLNGGRHIKSKIAQGNAIIEKMDSSLIANADSKSNHDLRKSNRNKDAKSVS